MNINNAFTKYLKLFNNMKFVPCSPQPNRRRRRSSNDSITVHDVASQCDYVVPDFLNNICLWYV